MKSVSGKMKLEMSQFRELAAFAQFGSDLDPETTAQLERGKRISEVLKQPQYQPLSEAWEVVDIALVTNGLIDDVPVENVTKFEAEFRQFIKKHHAKLLDRFANGEKVKPEDIKDLEKAANEFKKLFGGKK